MRTGRPKVERVQLPCAACGQILERRKTDVERSKTGRVFCDAVCRNTAGAKPRRGVDKPCESCGVSMYVQPSQAKRQRFCSKECHDKGQTRRVGLQCAYCGLIYELAPSQARLYRTHYCSKRCEGLARIKRPLDREHNGKPACLDRFGYVWVWEPDHPESGRYHGWMSEHRLVAEQMVGRVLTSEDEVNHINRDKADNRPENLQVLDGKTHAVITTNQRRSDRELLAEYIERFGPLN